MCEAEGRDRQDQRGRDGQSMGSGLFERRAGEKKKKKKETERGHQEHRVRVGCQRAQSRPFLAQMGLRFL